MKKSKFCIKRIQFIGHLINGFTREIDSFKKKMAQKMMKPQTGKQVESLLGFLNFLRDFIPNYMTIAALLDKLRKIKHLGKTWGKEQDKSFDFFKEVILNALVLSQSDWDREFHIATDASQYAVGAVLYQVDANDKKCYIVFASKTLQAGQRNYPTPKRELLAIIFAIKKFCSYVFGQKFRVEMDHKALYI